MHVQNWDDHRFVAVLARAGSLAQASVLMGVDRSTVQRRIESLEAQLGYSLFLRTGGRYRPLPEANPILTATRMLEATSGASHPATEGEAESLSGDLSVTTTDSIHLSSVSEMIDNFKDRRPALRINLSVTTRRLMLDRLEADVASRPSDSPLDHLVGRRIRDLAFGVYASRAYIENKSGKRRNQHSWIPVGDNMVNSPPGRRIEAHVPPERRVLRADSFLAIAEACRLGRGASLLPKA